MWCICHPMMIADADCRLPPLPLSLLFLRVDLITLLS